MMIVANREKDIVWLDVIVVVVVLVETVLNTSVASFDDLWANIVALFLGMTDASCAVVVLQWR